VGGAAITVTAAGTQDAVTTLIAIQAYPPEAEGYEMYHQVFSAFLPAMGILVPAVTASVDSLAAAYSRSQKDITEIRPAVFSARILYDGGVGG